MNFEMSASFAQQLDQNDTLSHFRERFYIPRVNNQNAIYYTGNSLGLQPKSAQDFIMQELEDWKNLGVEGHFKGKRPWFGYHKYCTQSLASLHGALEHEVVCMNNLTVNLHLLMASFYKPSGTRTKILMEAGAFPSDMYAVESQVRMHGLDPNVHIIEVKPQEGRHFLETNEILKAIDTHANELALVFFSGVQYYSGQFFDIQSITQKAHEVGALAGFDLAHTSGNRPLKLHEWNVDFAAWCSYKYLNSGPGGTSGVFIHEKHGLDPNTPRLAGWWGYRESTRFKMQKGFVPEPGAQGWQLSNAPVLNMASHLASLQIFDEAGIHNLAQKSDLLTGFTAFCIETACNKNPDLELQIITPPLPHRAAQLSLLTQENGKHLFDYLSDQGVIADWREPNVIRIAPVPLYNTFTESYKFAELLLQYKLHS